MRNAIAWLFREINVRIVYTQSPTVNRILKMFRLLSIQIQRWIPEAKDQTIVINNFDGDIKMALNPRRLMAASIYWTGFHEIKELIFLHRFIKPDMVFVDIGANQGEYTLFASKRLSSGKVFAFEPLPAMTKLLETNVTLNGFKNVVILNYGLSDKDGELPIYEMKDNHEGLATFHPGERMFEGTFNVKLKVLDDVFDSYGVNRLDFIKLDIEGGELFALRGARKLIIKFKPWVLIEINHDTYTMAGYSTNDVLTFFREVGYHPFLLTKDAELSACRSLPIFGNVIFKPS